ncbi:hypothetical protein BC834DRAFT_967940 [Gloeopeniophorella convolvens]|nr:hypothetical protein BC834DRAFT_967940 [Gloeopeniophorella convolvens]
MQTRRRPARTHTRKTRAAAAPGALDAPRPRPRHRAHAPASDAQRRTIFALSTPPGKSGVAVIRISGPDALAVWRAMVRPVRARAARAPAPTPWRLERCAVVDPRTDEVLDDALAVFFRAPRSFTTEDTLELHAEALRDLVEAETDVQRRAALRGAAGAARERLGTLRGEIVECLALVEALIDFGEGEDIEAGVYEQARARAQRLRDAVHAILSDNRRGEIVRAGVRLALFGPPNAGKSSLLNFLAQRDAAIVTPVPGTTRDVLELALDIGGLPVRVADTAGLRDAHDAVERIGIARARDAVQTADAALLVLSAADALVVPPDLAPLVRADTLVLLNKTDLLPAGTLAALPRGRGWAASLATQDGTRAFLDGLAGALLERCVAAHARRRRGDDAGAPLITHARHRAHLESACAFLDAFLATPPEDIVLGAEELRYAAQAVGRVTGAVDVEDVLDVIFGAFCIGK